MRKNMKTKMVFDWNKAAKIIFSMMANIDRVDAGLEGDMAWTGGCIFEDGIIVCDDYTFLASTHAKPGLSIDFKDGTNEWIECWQYDEDCEWYEDTKWPRSAVRIIYGRKEDE